MQVTSITRLWSALAVGFFVASCGGDGPNTAASSGGGSNTAPTYTVAGQVQMASSATVYMTDADGDIRTTLTSATGGYQFANVPNGTYTVSVVQSGEIFTPANQAISVAGANVNVPTITGAMPTGIDALPDAVIDAIDAQQESPLTLAQMFNPDGTSVADYLASRGITIPTTLTQFNEIARFEKRTQLSERDAPKQFVMTLPSAATAAVRREDVVDSMVALATFFECARATPQCTTWDFAAGPGPASTNPAQHGIQYVLNGKTVSARSKDACPDSLYGVDCSGLIYLIASTVGISLPSGTSADQANPSNWILPSDWQLQLVKVTDGSLQLGDIVYWSQASGGHIGIITTGSSVTNVISSTGGVPSPTQCPKNANPPRGPRSLTIGQLGLGNPTTTLRLQAPSTPNVTVSANPSSLSTGSSTTLTVTVAPPASAPAGSATPTGTVALSDTNGALTCAETSSSSVTLNASGGATCTATITSTATSDTITAMYSGDTNYAAASGTTTIAMSQPDQYWLATITGCATYPNGYQCDVMMPMVLPSAYQWQVYFPIAGSSSSDVVIKALDSEGTVVEALYPGVFNAGSSGFTWSGTDPGVNTGYSGTQTFTLTVDPTQTTSTAMGGTWSTTDAWVTIEGASTTTSSGLWTASLSTGAMPVPTMNGYGACENVCNAGSWTNCGLMAFSNRWVQNACVFQ